MVHTFNGPFLKCLLLIGIKTCIVLNQGGVVELTDFQMPATQCQTF